ncbi:MAG: SDR family NAD(P)-dependent oxidoreductase [Bacteroidetes bacterium]|nr:SDR family NAD(P)-dependent oxidoreductase [Bacteroidota bacterium]
MEGKQTFVLVTGASSGIGKAIATGLSSTYKTILGGRNQEKLLLTKEDCSAKNESIIFTQDLKELTLLEDKLSTFLLENNIEISHFVHCAGFMKMSPLKMMTVESIHNTFSTNVFSAALILKVLINRRFNNAALKSAVLISSNISGFGAKAFSVYGASKAALDGLVRSLAIELAPKVRINSVLPGAIHTEMTDSIFSDPETIQRMESAYPLGLGNPSDIFGIVEFLLSEKARWITGQQFYADGGRTVNITG